MNFLHFDDVDTGHVGLKVGLKNKTQVKKIYFLSVQTLICQKKAPLVTSLNHSIYSTVTLFMKVG